MQDAAKASSQRLAKYMCQNAAAIIDAMHNANSINGMGNYGKDELAIPDTDEELALKATEERVYPRVLVEVTKLREESSTPHLANSQLFIVHYLDNLLAFVTEMDKCQIAYKECTDRINSYATTHSKVSYDAIGYFADQIDAIYEAKGDDWEK